jgi:hypothetical protein
MDPIIGHIAKLNLSCRDAKEFGFIRRVIDIFSKDSG